MTLIQKLRNFIDWLRLSAADKVAFQRFQQVQVALRAIKRLHQVEAPKGASPFDPLPDIKQQLRKFGWSERDIEEAIYGTYPITVSERAEILGRLWTL